MNRTIYLSAGEPSGDLHGAEVVAALRTRWPDAIFVGTGGPRMAAAGVELLATTDRMAVMGFSRVIARLPFFLRLERQVARALVDRRVDLVIPIDYPGFNLRLARRAKGAGIPVLYYIAPQLWAWHQSRAVQLARYTDSVAVILPFEVPFLAARGVRATYVGHPLLDQPPPNPLSLPGLSSQTRVAAFFPGSRPQEVDRLLPCYREVAARLSRLRPDVRIVFAQAEQISDSHFQDLPWERVHDARALLARADAALVKSGTTTLQAALADTPMVIAYRTDPFSYAIARRLVAVDHIGLVNLVAGRRLAPEYVQGGLDSAAMARELLELLDPASSARVHQLQGLREVRERLGAGGAAERVASMAVELLDGRSYGR